jgi:hypothetical protein
VFFVDINNVQSGLSFDVSTEGVTTTGTVPEPPSVALMLAALMAMGVMWRIGRKAA